MAAHRHHGVVPICRVLQVAPSAVRSAMSRPVCARRQTDDEVKPMLLEVVNANYQVYVMLTRFLGHLITRVTV